MLLRCWLFAVSGLAQLAHVIHGFALKSAPSAALAQHARAMVQFFCCAPWWKEQHAFKAVQLACEGGPRQAQFGTCRACRVQILSQPEGDTYWTHLKRWWRSSGLALCQAQCNSWQAWDQRPVVDVTRAVKLKKPRQKGTDSDFSSNYAWSDFEGIAEHRAAFAAAQSAQATSSTQSTASAAVATTAKACSSPPPASGAPMSEEGRARAQAKPMPPSCSQPASAGASSGQPPEAVTGFAGHSRLPPPPPPPPVLAQSPLTLRSRSQQSEAESAPDDPPSSPEDGAELPLRRRRHHRVVAADSQGAAATRRRVRRRRSRHSTAAAEPEKAADRDRERRRRRRDDSRAASERPRRRRA